MAQLSSKSSQRGDIFESESKNGQKVTELEQEKHGNDGNDGIPLTSAYASLSRGAAIRKFWRISLAGLGISISGMYIGYALSVVGSIVVNEGFINQFATLTDPETGERVLDAKHIALWTAVGYGAQIVFQLLSPISADRWGRKVNLWVLTFFLTLSIVLGIVAKDWKVLTASRICSGFAGGFISTSIMVYLSEIAMPQFRGALLGTFSFSFALGQAFLAIGLKILNDTNPMGFRNMFYSEFVFCGLWLVPLVWLPESHVWLASQGRHDEGKKSLRRLIGNVQGYDLEHEYLVIRNEVEKSIALSKEISEHSWRAMLEPRNMRRTIIATLPFTFQNFVGVPLIFGYATYFFSLANVEDPFLGNMIIQIILLIGIAISFYWVDKVGRRVLVVYGGVIMGCITMAIGGLAWINESKASGIGLIVLCSLWAFVYANSLAPIGWISLVEVSTPRLRAKTAAIAAVIQSCTGILFSYTVPLLLSNQGAGWGQKIGLFFSGLTFLFLIAVVYMYPETKNRTYQELDELFERKIPAWRFASAKTAYRTGVEIREEAEA